MHFKLRVLGLVEAFIRKETTNPLVLVSLLSTGVPSKPMEYWLYCSLRIFYEYKVHLLIFAHYWLVRKYSNNKNLSV